MIALATHTLRACDIRKLALQTSSGVRRNLPREGPQRINKVLRVPSLCLKLKYRQFPQNLRNKKKIFTELENEISLDYSISNQTKEK